MMSETRLIFDHLPKAAGSSFYTILRRLYAEPDIYYIDGRRVAESVATFRSLSPREQAAFRCIMGHTAYRLFSLIPEPKTCVTFLREPIDRLVSHYFYVRRNAGHRLHEPLTTQNMSLDKYVCSDMSVEFVNPTTRLLSGLSAEAVAADMQGAYEAARAAIDRDFVVVGVQDRFDESLLLLQHRLGWRTLPPYRRENVTRGRPAADTLGADARVEVERRNWADIQLYQYCADRLDQALQAEIPDLPTRLARYQRRCRAHARYRATTKPLRKAKDYVNLQVKRGGARTLRILGVPRRFYSKGEAG